MLQIQSYQGVTGLNREKYDLDSLLKEIDEKQTLENVRHFLLVSLPRLRRISHLEAGELKSPSMDGMPKPESTENHVADGYLKVIGAQEAVQNTAEAIKHCSADSQALLFALYFEGKSDTAVRLELHHEHSKYYAAKRKAMFEFADAFERYDDLHSYMDDA